MINQKIILIILSSFLFANSFHLNDDPDDIETEIHDLSYMTFNVSDDYFIENVGQWNEEILFTAKTEYGHIGIGKNRFYLWLISNQNEDGNNPAYLGRTIVYTFMNTNDVVPSGDNMSGIKSNYLYSEGTFNDVKHFHRIRYGNLWDGIDLILYFHNREMKFDFICEPHSNLDMIKYKIEGQKDLTLKNNDLHISTSSREKIIEKGLIAYYSDNKEKIGIEYKNNNGVIHYQVDGNDESRPIMIDPIISSTFIGGTGSDGVADIEILSNDEIYIAGYTGSVDFPTTPGSFSVDLCNISDIYVMKMNKSNNTLIYSTYIGGTSYDQVTDIVVGGEGSVHLVGFTYSNDFPTTPNGYNTTYYEGHGNVQDALYLKLDKNGSELSYSTYLGGESYDTAYGIDLISDDMTVIVGYTSSSYFPTTSNAFDNTINGGGDCFITVIGINELELNYSTYFGGSKYDSGINIRKISKGVFIFSGITASSNIPLSGNYIDRTFNGGNDAFIIELNITNNEIIFSTYIGGRGSEVMNNLQMKNNMLYIIGSTSSLDFPVSLDAYDNDYDSVQYSAYMMKIDLDRAEIVYSTYIEGSSEQFGYDLYVDDNDRVFGIGRTKSDDFPTTYGCYDNSYNGDYDVFLVSLNENGTNLTYSTYIGGNEYDEGYSIGQGNDGNIIIAGSTNSASFPASNNGFDNTYNGLFDGFLMEINLSIPPMEPENFTLTSGDSFINLSWKDPRNNGDADILHYNIYRGTRSGELTLHKDLCDNRYFNDTGLTNGITYYYQIAAVNFVGEGIRSRERNITPYGRPSSPLNLSLHQSSDSIMIEWDEPRDKGGLLILSYDVYRGEKEDIFNKIGSNDGNIRSYIDKNVINGTRYFYHVTAVNSIGGSESSSSGMILPTGPPTMPLNVTISAGSEYVVINWNEPLSDGGIEIDGYKIYRRNASREFNVIAVVTDLHYNDTATKNGNYYSYQLTSYNKKGESDRTPIIFAKPADFPDAPENFKIGSEPGRIILTWEKSPYGGGLLITEYRLYRKVEGGDLSLLKIVDSDQSSYHDMNVTNGIRYFYCMTSVNLIGESRKSETISMIPYGIPSTPRNPEILSERSELILHWGPPDDSGGGEIIEYRIFRGLENEMMEIYMILPGSNVSLIDLNVTVGMEYQYSVSAKNARYESSRSKIVTGIAYREPFNVRGFTIASDDEQLHLSWKLPEEDGGADVSAIRLYRSYDGLDFDLHTTLDPTETSFRDVNVTNGNEYHYYIEIINLAGYSNSTNGITGIPRGFSSPPRNIHATPIDDSITIIWDPPENDGGYGIERYNVYRKYGGEDFILVGTVNSKITCFNDTFLDNGRYVYMVTAVNEYGESDHVTSSIVYLDRSDQDDNMMIITLIISTSFLVILLILTILIVRSYMNRNKGVEGSEEDRSQEIIDPVPIYEHEYGDPLPLEDQEQPIP